MNVWVVRRWNIVHQRLNKRDSRTEPVVRVFSRSSASSCKCIINVLPTDANSNQMGASNTTDHRIFVFLSLLSSSFFSFLSFSLRFFPKKKRSQQPCRIHLSFTFPFSLGVLNLAMCTPVSLKGKERNSQVSQLPVACARSRISVLVDRNTYRPFSRTMCIYLA